jgi:hypothetical protein
MPQVRTKKTFLHKGETIQPGTVMLVPGHALEVLGDFAEVIMLSPADLKIQQDASDFVRLCMHHENTYPDGHCQVKHDRLDPMTKCKVWQLKSGRVIH